MQWRDYGIRVTVTLFGYFTYCRTVCLLHIIIMIICLLYIIIIIQLLALLCLI